MKRRELKSEKQTSKSRPGLLGQLLRFGLVGVISFIVDFLIYTCTVNVLGISYLVGGLSGFTVSVIVNYLLSMRFVFKSRDDLSKRKEFTIFLILSIIGLGLNEAILYIAIDLCYLRWNVLWSRAWLPEKWMNIVAKLGATGIVMIFNFVSRKIFLEQKEPA